MSLGCVPLKLSSFPGIFLFLFLNTSFRAFLWARKEIFAFWVLTFLAPNVNSRVNVTSIYGLGIWYLLLFWISLFWCKWHVFGGSALQLQSLHVWPWVTSLPFLSLGSHPACRVHFTSLRSVVPCVWSSLLWLLRQNTWQRQLKGVKISLAYCSGVSSSWQKDLAIGAWGSCSHSLHSPEAESWRQHPANLFLFIQRGTDDCCSSLLQVTLGTGKAFLSPLKLLGCCGSPTL